MQYRAGCISIGNMPRHADITSCRKQEEQYETIAQTADLARLHEMVMKVKADRKVGAAYMNLMEMERRMKRDLEEEIEKRIKDQIEKRIKEEVWEKGRAEEIIDSGWEFNFSEEEILERLQRKLNINTETAKEYLADYMQRGKSEEETGH